MWELFIVIHICTQGQRRLCICILDTIHFGISGSTRPEGRYCNNTNRKWTTSQMEQTPQPLLSHKNLLHIFSTHLGSSQTLEESEAHSLGRNEAAASSQTFSPTYPPALSFDLAIQIADFLTSAEVCMPPAHVHNAPGLGPDRMPQIPAVWVYSGSKACQQCTHEQSSSCCVRFLLMSL